MSRHLLIWFPDSDAAWRSDALVKHLRSVNGEVGAIRGYLDRRSSSNSSSGGGGGLETRSLSTTSIGQVTGCHCCAVLYWIVRLVPWPWFTDAGLGTAALAPTTSIGQVIGSFGCVGAFLYGRD